MSVSRNLAQTVHDNLNYHHLWSALSIDSIKIEETELYIIYGTPPNKLHADDPEPLVPEYIVPARLSDKWTLDKWNIIFNALSQSNLDKKRPKRITMAMETDDSTIVYYFVYDGLIKPRKN